MLSLAWEPLPNPPHPQGQRNLDLRGAKGMGQEMQKSLGENWGGRMDSEDLPFLINWGAQSKVA